MQFGSSSATELLARLFICLVQDAAAKQGPFISTLFAKLAFKKPAKLYISNLTAFSAVMPTTITSYLYSFTWKIREVSKECISYSQADRKGGGHLPSV